MARLSETDPPDNVGEDEVLLRRFSPIDPQHAELRDSEIAPKYGAFYFKDQECSVYRQQLLDDYGLTWEHVATATHPGVLFVRAGRVTSIEVPTSSGVVRPFYVVAHPLDTEPNKALAASHAEIVMMPLSRSEAKNAQRALIKRVDLVRIAA